MNIIVQELPDGQDSSNCGVLIAECGASNCGVVIADCGLNVKSDSPNPQSAVNTPQSLILLPGAEVCETRPFSTRICFEVRRAGTSHSHFRFWHTAWFPTRCVTGPPVAVEAALITQALDELSIRNHGYRYEAVLEDRGQRPGDAR